MNVRKAVITAAGDGHVGLPLQAIVDRSGRRQTVFRLTLEDLLASGIDEVAVIVRPGKQEAFVEAADELAGRLTFVEQHDPRGYGDALLRARPFLKEEPCLHLVSDHLFLSHEDRPCAAQILEVAAAQGCPVSAVQATREHQIIDYGTIGATPLPQADRLYEVSRVIEKPTPTEAEQNLVVAGQRAGYYLCLFGMHVLTPVVFEILQRQLEGTPEDRTLDLTSSLDLLAQQERFIAAEVNGQRFNLSDRYGQLLAQLAITLSGQDRDRLLSELVTLMAG